MYKELRLDSCQKFFDSLVEEMLQRTEVEREGGRKNISKRSDKKVKKTGKDEEAIDRRSSQHTLAFASRLIHKELPKNKLPEKSNDPKAVQQLIREHLLLDRGATQNMATFLTEWMEPEAEELMIASFGKNMADKDEYPQTIDLQNKCVKILAHLWHSPDDCVSVGTCTSGSSEAYMLGALAAKFRWRNKMKAAGKPHDKPNIVYGANAQVVLNKFALYFDVEARKVPVTEQSKYVMDPSEAIKLVDENTIAVAVILGSTYTGHLEDVKQMSDLLDQLQREKGLDVPIHVDAASGGFVVPFAFRDVVWDFRLPRVKSINVSGHKYGLVYPGVGWVVFRDKTDLPSELVFHLDYLGGDTPTFNLNFSRSSNQIIGQYYNFMRLGREGYEKVISNCLFGAKFMSEYLQDSKYFFVRSEVHLDKPAIPVVCVSLTKEVREKGVDEYEIMNKLRENGWTVPAYKLPHTLEEETILRVVVRETHSLDLLETLAEHIVQAVEHFLEKNESKKEEGVAAGGVQTKQKEKQKPTAAEHHKKGFNRSC